MRLFHLTTWKHGLNAIENQRLKVATYSNMNDPYELLSLDLTAESYLEKGANFKSWTNERYGGLCFSKTCLSTLLWSHYADKHKGVALEFDVCDSVCNKILYSRKRLNLDFPNLIKSKQITHEMIHIFAHTKSHQWKYEKEVRVAVNLAECQKINDLFFENFSEKLSLTSLIIGENTTFSETELQKALPHGKSILVKKICFSTNCFNLKSDPTHVDFCINSAN